MLPPPSHHLAQLEPAGTVRGSLFWQHQFCGFWDEARKGKLAERGTLAFVLQTAQQEVLSHSKMRLILSLVNKNWQKNKPQIPSSQVNSILFSPSAYQTRWSLPGLPLLPSCRGATPTNSERTRAALTAVTGWGRPSSFQVFRTGGTLPLLTHVISKL